MKNDLRWRTSLKHRTALVILMAVLFALCGESEALCRRADGAQTAGSDSASTSVVALEPGSIFLAHLKSGKKSGRTIDVVNDPRISASSGVFLYSAVGGAYAPAECGGPGGEGAAKNKPAPGEANRGLPASFALVQNFPNPFNPSSVIRYALPVQSTVTLKVYDVIGREVGTLVDSQPQEPGYHAVVFDGSGLASGVYYYRLSAGSFTDVKKMMLMR
jgi:hypothetical protein